MNKDGKGPAIGVGRGLGPCNKYFLRGIAALRDPWVWWAFFKGIVIGLLLGWWLL